MMEAVIKNNRIVFKGAEILVDDLLNDGFYKRANAEADRFNIKSYGVNEVFMNLVQPYLAIEGWIKDKSPDKVYLYDANDDYYYFTKDICDKYSIEARGVMFLKPLKSRLLFNITVFSSALLFLYLLLKIPYDNNIVTSPKFSVPRTRAAIKKFKRFEEIHQEIENPYDKGSIYRLFPKCVRVKWVLKAYIRAYRSINEMEAFYEPLLGPFFKYSLMDYYKKRIVYAEVYRLMLDRYFDFFQESVFYTGNNLDRFSVIEDEICTKHSIKSYCIPHGIEYGFKFPKGFSCDVFYAHSQFTADYLNRLYNTSKYVFEEGIIKRMFEYGYDKPHDQMVIFFTEPREVNVNVDIIKGLLPRLQNEGIQLFLKLHPGDNKSNYEGIDVEYISDYDLSMTGNICISRKSTILIEAIYNRSVPIAIITNPKDQSLFNTFPSLNAEQIIKTYSVGELFSVIKKYAR